MLRIIFMLFNISHLLPTTAAQSSCRTPAGATGYCIPLQSCPSLRSLLQDIESGGASIGRVTLLRNSVCGFRFVVPLLCCPINDVLTNMIGKNKNSNSNKPIQNAISFASISSPNSNKYLNGEPIKTFNNSYQKPNFHNIKQSSFLSHKAPPPCGTVLLQDRIVGGNIAPLGAWPWIALLGYEEGNGSMRWNCAATLISSKYLVTAAHCLTRRHNRYRVRLGEHRLSTNPDCKNNHCAPVYQELPVAEVITHPSYNTPCRFCNDIALLRLATQAPLSNGINSICLPLNPKPQMGFSEEEFENKIAKTAGWGSTSRNFFKPQSSDVLLQTSLPLRETDFCRRIRSSYPFPSMVLCGGGLGRDSCNGDSGGPLTLTNNFGTKHFLVGITSSGPANCGSPDTQGIYTNVRFHIPWILQNMNL